MRSSLVFRAEDIVTNRFELCRVVSCSARAMSRNSSQMHEAINSAFDAVAKQVGFCSSLGAKRTETNQKAGIVEHQIDYAEVAAIEE
jgi:hypothetical protein